MSFNLLLLLLLGLPFGATVKRKEAIGTIGSLVFLDPEHQGDLSRSEILWTFTVSNKRPVTVVDYVPDKPVEEPNEQFRSRLQLNASSGCLLVHSLKPEDQGVFNFVVDERMTSIIELFLFCISGVDSIIIIASITGLVSSLVSLSGFLLLWCLEKKSKQASLSLTICKVLSLVATFIALASWIGIKDTTFVPIITLFLVSVHLLIIVAPIIIQKVSCLFNGEFQEKKDCQPSICLNDITVILILIVTLKEEIQQNKQSCHTSILTWNIPIALLVSCVLVISVFLATYCFSRSEWSRDLSGV